MFGRILLVACITFAFATPVWAQRAVLLEPKLKSLKFAGKDILKKDSIVTIYPGIEYEVEIEAAPGSFSASRSDGILEVLGTRPSDGLKVILQQSKYKITRVDGKEVATGKLKVPAEVPSYSAQLRVLEKNNVLIQRNISIKVEK